MSGTDVFKAEAQGCASSLEQKELTFDLPFRNDAVFPLVALSVSDGARTALPLPGAKLSKTQDSPELSARWGTSAVVAAMADREVLTHMYGPAAFRK